MPKKIKKLTHAQKREAKSVNFTPKVSPEELKLYDKAIFSWTAPEYIQHHRTIRWYMFAAIIAGLFLLSAAFMQNWTMVIAVVAFAGVYVYLQHHHPPKRIHITISAMGIKVGNMIFPYQNIQAFWIFYNPPHVKTMNLRVHKHFFSDVVIQLDDQDPVQIREYLVGQVPEWEGKTEQFGDILLRLLKL